MVIRAGVATLMLTRTAALVHAIGHSLADDADTIACDVRSVQARAWRSERRWVALWAAVAALTLAHTVTLVFALGASALSLACAALFAWVALLGVGGALRGLAAAASADTHAGQFAANLRVRQCN